MKKRILLLTSLLLAALLCLPSCLIDIFFEEPETSTPSRDPSQYSAPSGDPEIPEDNQPHAATTLYSVAWYTGSEYAVVNGNVPFFTEAEKTTRVFENYAAQDALGRCGVAYANICEDLMPTEERGDISSVKPTGWVQNQYDVIKSKNLYNRSHLIAFQLAGENANKANLITGTRYMNETMIPFENMVADYVKETGNHVLYRVTPVFTDNNLLADGVLMEARSVEDDDICFCVFCYNVQPGIYLDYKTGNNRLSGEPAPAEETETEEPAEVFFVLNTSGKKVHLSTCTYAATISEGNRQEYHGTAEELQKAYPEYVGCGRCKPYEGRK